MTTTPRSILDTSRLAPLYAQTAPLLHWTGHQIDRAYLYVELSGRFLRGRITADTTPYGDLGIPAAVYSGRVHRFSVPAEIRGRTLEALIRRISPLLERLVVGSEWDLDSEGERRGTLTEDAAEARQEIEAEIERLDETDVVAVWEAGDWLRETRGDLLAALRGGETAEALCDRLTEEAAADDVVLGARDLARYVGALVAEIEAE